ncbi:MAG TPA: aldehyde dehydrogenase family protein, partial [Acidimicrobiia bacterium]|nr:aldehyde dehydrogenase family protein [Acidimicrobiia bacterium]
MKGHLLIDGRLVPGAGPHFEVIDPATGEIDATLAGADEAQLAAATAAAARAQPGWEKLAQPERSRMLHAVAEAIEANRGDLAAAL